MSSSNLICPHAKSLTDNCHLERAALARVLLAQDTRDSRDQAFDLLKRLHDFVLFTHNTRFQIDVLALQALLHDARSEGTVAIEKLTRALALSEPGGFIRLFVDLGPRMAELLKQLIRKNIAVGYIGRILAAIKEDAHRTVQSESDHLTAQASPLGAQPLIEPLTNRELQILDLLPQRLQNKEIAAELSISSETVKEHLNNIYGKLNVGNRLEAVEKARTLGILTPR